MIMSTKTISNGSIVQHFKRTLMTNEEMINNPTKYLYKILDIDALHTESEETLVIYRALYPDYNGKYKTFARPHEIFFSEVDIEKYPMASQKYKFELFKWNIQ